MALLSSVHCTARYESTVVVDKQFYGRPGPQKWSETSSSFSLDGWECTQVEWRNVCSCLECKSRREMMIKKETGVASSKHFLLSPLNMNPVTNIEVKSILPAGRKDPVLVFRVLINTLLDIHWQNSFFRLDAISDRDLRGEIGRWGE